MDSSITLTALQLVIIAFAGSIIGVIVVLLTLIIMNRVTMVDKPRIISDVEATTAKLRSVAQEYEALNGKVSSKRDGGKPESPSVATKPSRSPFSKQPVPIEPEVDYSGVSIQPLTQKQYQVLTERAESYEAYRLHETADLLGVPEGAVLQWIGKKLLIGQTVKGDTWVSSLSILALVDSQQGVADYVE